MFSLFIICLFSFCMLAATISDLSNLTIPNIYILLLLGGFIIAVPFSNITVSEFIYSHLAIALIFLFIGFWLFVFGWVGAGDVKLLSVTSLWLGLPLAIDYLFLASIFGGIFACGLLFFRQQILPIFMLNIGWVNVLYDKKNGLPYGVALGPCGLYLFFDSIWLV